MIRQTDYRTRIEAERQVRLLLSLGVRAKVKKIDDRFVVFVSDLIVS